MCLHLHRKLHKKFGNYQLYKCLDCKLIFNSIYEDNFDTNKLYNDFYDNKGQRFSPILEKVVRFFRWWRAFYIKFFSYNGKSCLDIGCGRGYLIYYLREYFGYKKVAGTQIATKAIKFAKEKLKLTIYGRDLLDINFFEKKFDTIILWHVLEHITTPEDYIKKIYSLLNNKGKLFIQVPNYNSWTAKFTGKYWLGLDLQHHLYFFTPDALKKILKKNGFTVKKISTLSVEYSNILSIQSVLGFITKKENELFDALTKKSIPLKLYPIFIIAILISPIIILINLLLWRTKYGEVITIIADK